jgi:hypothetical protein
MAELGGADAAIVINTRDVEAGYSGLERMWADASQLAIPLILIPKLAGASLQAAVREYPELRVRVRTHAWVAEGACARLIPNTSDAAR